MWRAINWIIAKIFTKAADREYGLGQTAFADDKPQPPVKP